MSCGVCAIIPDEPKSISDRINGALKADGAVYTDAWFIERIVSAAGLKIVEKDKP
jgi:hypothetical protein